MAGKKFNQMNKALIHWEEMTDEIEALTEEYEESGWKTLVFHPGDVSTTLSETTDQKVGFRLVVPESELEELAKIINENEYTFDEFEVYRALVDDLLLYVVIVKSSECEQAIIFPVYYDPKMDRQFVKDARQQDVIYTNITNLDKSKVLSFSHEKPALLLP